jgi:hypothetical protein
VLDDSRPTDEHELAGGDRFVLKGKTWTDNVDGRGITANRRQLWKRPFGFGDREGRGERTVNKRREYPPIALLSFSSDFSSTAVGAVAGRR